MKRKKIWRKKESNALVLVPEGYEPVLGQISIESQNTVKTYFMNMVFIKSKHSTLVNAEYTLSTP